MKNSKLYQLLNSMSVVELSRMRKLVNSPYFNTDTKLCQLFDLLCPQGGHPSETTTREALDAALFPNEPFDYFRISNLLSYITGLAETFLMLEKQQQEPLNNRLSLLRSLRERGLTKAFEQQEKGLRRGVGKALLNTEDRLYLDYQLSTEHYLQHGSSGQRSWDESLPNRLRKLNEYELLVQLKGLCEIVNRSNIVGANVAIDTAALQRFEQQPDNYGHLPALGIYGHIYYCLTEEQGDEHFSQLKQALSLNKEKLVPAELRDMYRYAQNYCIKQSNKGRTEYLAELLELYKQALADEVLTEEGELLEWDFKNIVTLGARLKDFAWTEDFIKTYSPMLPKEIQDNAHTYNLAYLLYAKGDSNKAHELLYQVQFTDVFYNLGAKVMLLKIYYDEQELDALDSHFHAFGTYLRRNKKISPYQKKVHQNLLRYTRKLLQIKNRMGIGRKEVIQRDLSTLEQEISSTREITNINWVQEKVIELKSGLGGQV